MANRLRPSWTDSARGFDCRDSSPLICTHLFRHDYITRKALDGENPSVLKRWVGHRTLR
jgi:hypothetical protein